jgi:hypothetical protein
MPQSAYPCRSEDDLAKGRRNPVEQNLAPNLASRAAARPDLPRKHHPSGFVVDAVVAGITEVVGRGRRVQRPPSGLG